MKTLLITALVAVFPFAAQACMVPPHDADEVQRFLTEEYGENRVFSGVRENGMLLEFWLNPATGTWTVTTTDGELMCPLDVGEDFMPAQMIEIPGEPS